MALKQILVYPILQPLTIQIRNILGRITELEWDQKICISIKLNQLTIHSV